MQARIALVYLMGIAALAYGFYQFWRDGTANAHAMMIGGTCLGTAALVQVVQDLWERLRRRRR
jgi:hypothetical protein